MRHGEIKKVKMGDGKMWFEANVQVGFLPENCYMPWVVRG
jgi:hypothetical protein